ncbi:MAG: signal protein, partial [Thauera sp.]|nr:signal protein [Thauera sp.]
PYVTWSRSLLDPKDRPFDLDRPIPHELPPPLAGYPVAVGHLRGLYPTITGYTRHDQTTIGAGVRYDVAESVALKLQVDRIDAKRSSTLLDDRGYVTGPRALTVFSATLDFVF